MQNKPNMTLDEIRLVDWWCEVPHEKWCKETSVKYAWLKQCEYYDSISKENDQMREALKYITESLKNNKRSLHRLLSIGLMVLDGKDIKQVTSIKNPIL